jgi:hypothetical protein
VLRLCGVRRSKEEPFSKILCCLPAFVSFCSRMWRRRTPIRPDLSFVLALDLDDIAGAARRGAAPSATTLEAHYRYDRAPSFVHHTSAFTNSCRFFVSDSSGILRRALIRAGPSASLKGRPGLTGSTAHTRIGSLFFYIL